MIEIRFNSNPNMPRRFNHLGSRVELSGQDSREFENLDNAVKFWLECSWPITTPKEMGLEEWTTQFPDLRIDEKLEEIEIFFKYKEEEKAEA